VGAGVDRIIVNVHHHAAAIEVFVREHDLGAEVLISRERERPLETGGGLLHARALLRRNGPIFLHNVDVIADTDLRGMYAATVGSRALAVLAVNERPTSRHLLFDQDGLFGRLDAREGTRIEARASHGTTRAWAFAGVHVIAPELLDLISETGVFSILEPYLRLAGAGRRILPFPLGDALWLEVGTAERLASARRVLAASVRTAGNASAPNQETGP
jgi:NDP-sugar pyrophosphorylase family protein